MEARLLERPSEAPSSSRIGWPKPSDVSCIRAVWWGKPQSQGGARLRRPWYTMRTVIAVNAMQAATTSRKMIGL